VAARHALALDAAQFDGDPGNRDRRRGDHLAVDRRIKSMEAGLFLRARRQ